MKPREETFEIDTLNEKGYGVGKSGDSLVECLNALPGETVRARIYTRKKGRLQADVLEVLTPAPYRVKPQDEGFGSTSPYQIITFDHELIIKQDSINKLFSDIDGITFNSIIANSENQWNYRNKVEFSFYADDSNTIHLAFHKRGSSKGKIAVQKSAIVEDKINQDAIILIRALNSEQFSAFDFKTVIFRFSQVTNSTVAVLYCKVDPASDTNNFYSRLVNSIKELYLFHIHIVYSDKRSPASIISSIVFSQGDWDLTEEVGDLEFLYPADSFFQVNPKVFSKIIWDIRDIIVNSSSDSASMELLDLYAGVGTIGLCLSNLFNNVHGVELFPDSQKYALENARRNLVNNYSFEVASTTDVISSFQNKECVIVDPPRSGLEQKIIKAIIQYQPKYLFYVSCNPITQHRDLLQLQERYRPVFSNAYNLYPKTPHLESLVILERKV